jgi:hypothetical protein
MDIESGHREVAWYVMSTLDGNSRLPVGLKHIVGREANRDTDSLRLNSKRCWVESRWSKGRRIRIFFVNMPDVWVQTEQPLGPSFLVMGF